MVYVESLMPHGPPAYPAAQLERLGPASVDRLAPFARAGWARTRSDNRTSADRVHLSRELEQHAGGPLSVDPRRPPRGDREAQRRFPVPRRRAAPDPPVVVHGGEEGSRRGCIAPCDEHLVEHDIVEHAEPSGRELAGDESRVRARLAHEVDQALPE